MLGRATVISDGAGQNCVFWNIFRVCSRNLDAVGELHHSLSPSLGGLEPVLVRDPREVCALLWVSGRTVAGFGVPLPLPSVLGEACRHPAAVAEAGTVPHGVGTLQSHGLLLAALGQCDQICYTALMLGCCWQCWHGGNIWEQLAAQWGESWGFPMALPLLSQLLGELRG